MHTEERRLLTRFLEQLKNAKASGKDPEADALINQAISQQPDAAYLLVQKALLQEQALNAAKAQIAQLQDELDQLRGKRAHGGSFLGSDPWGAAQTRPANTPPAGAPLASPYAPGPAGQSAAMSFLSTAAATAAGVAGGAFLFQGIENLLHRGSSGGFFEPTSTAPEPVENITINEYYTTDTPASDLGFNHADVTDATVSDLGFDQADFDDTFDGFDSDDESLDV